MISMYLQGRISIETINMVISQTKLLFSENVNIKAPDILILYQQRIISTELLDTLIEQHYQEEIFYKIKDSWIDPEIIKAFKEYCYIPLEIDYKKNIIIAGTIPEQKLQDVPFIGTFSIKPKVIKLYEYVNLYLKYYGENPSFIKELPIADLFSMLIKEAIDLKATDITISQKKQRIDIYFNVNKRKIYSKRNIAYSSMDSLVKLLTTQANSATSVSKRKPIYFTLNLSNKYRGRTVINHTYWGHAITIRLLSNEIYNNTFLSLNIPMEIQEFLRKYYISVSSGLKLLAGPTYSGKNTTIIATLEELHKKNDIKIVSIENPVEILTDYIEQIDTETPEEFKDCVKSTLRQNPDIVYIAEMTDYTSSETMKIANTGKEVLSTIHVNSISEVPLRIKNLTGIEMNEIISILDSIIYQNLLPKKCPFCKDIGCENCYKAGVVPVFSYLHINKELRRKLIGCSSSEIYCLLEENTINCNQIETLYTQGIISEKTYQIYRSE